MHFKIINRRFFIYIVIALPERNSLVAPVLKNLPHLFTSGRVKQNVVVRHLPHAGLRVPVFQDAAFQGHIPDALCFQLMQNGLTLGIQQHIFSDRLIFGFEPLLLCCFIGICKNRSFLQCHADHGRDRMLFCHDQKLLQIRIGQNFFLRRSALERTRHQIKQVFPCLGHCTHFAVPQYSFQWL